MTTSTEAPTETDRSETSLRARLRVEPHPAVGCGLLESGQRGEEINRNEVCRDGDCGDGGDCRAEVTVTDGEDQRRRLVGSTIGPHCVCPVFPQNDCVVSIDSFRDGALFMSVTVPSRRELQSIVEELREREASVHLERILPLEDDQGEERTIELDANAITEKQREAVEMAIREGYYDTPRRADLDDLAAKLGISRSAVSQRLNAAEAILVRELGAAETGTRNDAMASSDAGRLAASD